MLEGMTARAGLGAMLASISGVTFAPAAGYACHGGPAAGGAAAAAEQAPRARPRHGRGPGIICRSYIGNSWF